MNDAIVTLKPSVQALLELHPFKRGAGWMDDLTRAVFDLPPDAPFTPEQRNFTKRYLHAFVYGMQPMALIDAYKAFSVTPRQIEAAELAIKRWRDTVAGVRLAETSRAAH